MNLEKLRIKVRDTIVISAVALLFVVTVFGGYSFIRSMVSKPVYEDKVIAKGIIVEKYDTSYSCGSKGRYTCYTRYFSVEGESVVVGDALYNQKRVGDHITLTMNTLVDSGYAIGPWRGVSIVIFWVMLLCLVISFFVWVFSGDDCDEPS